MSGITAGIRFRLGSTTLVMSSMQARAWLERNVLHLPTRCTCTLRDVLPNTSTCPYCMSDDVLQDYIERLVA